MKVLSITVVLALFLGASPTLADVEYSIDGGNSSVSFSVRHMVISKVRGAFSSFNGSVVLDESTGEVVAITGQIDTKTINTNNNRRDEHLRSSEFFDVESFPTISFETSEIQKKNNHYVAVGMLTMRGVTRKIEAPFTITESINDPWGNIRVGLEVILTIDRRDYGIKWSEKLDSGGLVVSNEVKIEINIEAIHR